ncbi:MAG: choice-of-anchor L domain-containing protein [Bacteroidales bacterium]
MKKVKLIGIACLLFISNYIIGQNFTIYSCKTDNDVINIIDTVLLKGLKEKGFVKNISFKGKPYMFARFEQGDSIGFKRGIIMSSGLSDSLIGPNNNKSFSYETKTIGEPDLELLSKGLPSIDPAVIEFDFIPQSTSLKFKYIFGSEEYNEFVGDQFTYCDAFGFFVSGPGIDGAFTNKAINIAKFEDSEDYISIKTLNCGYQPNFKSPPPFEGPNCDFLIWNNKFNDHPNGKAFPEFDAYTLPMEAKAKLIPCKIYHLKLAVSDIKDYANDSGVFLEAGSFDFGKLNSKVINQEEFDKTLIHNCNQIEYKVFLESANDYDSEIKLTYKGNAIVGEDVNQLPEKIIIPANKTSASFPIKVIKEDLYPGNKKLIIKTSLSYCEMKFGAIDTIRLQAYTPMKSIGLPEEKIIDSETTESLQFKANIQGGVPPYSVSWKWDQKQYEQNPFILENPHKGELLLFSQDICRKRISDTCKIIIQYPDPDPEPTPEINDELFVPNAFTPNGDGRNDFLKIKSDMIDDFKCYIYNRWGQQIYKSSDVNMCWDGTFGKEPMPIGTYLISITYTNKEQQKKSYKGIISLIR